MKKILALLLALTMVFALCACGGSSAPAAEAPAAEAPAGEKVTLDVIISQYGNKTQEWWTKFESDFEAANQDIDLKIEIVSWNDIYQVVNTRISTNSQPDILNISGFADYVADDLLMPAEEYVSAKTKEVLIPSFWESNAIDGTVWALPILASCRALFCNMDILNAAGIETPPTTWEEVMDACAAIKASDPNVVPWGLDISTDEGQAAFAYYTWSYGGGFVDADGNWALNSPENVEAIEFALSLYSNGYTNPQPATQTRYDLQDMFAAGKLAMVIAPNSLPTYAADKDSTVNMATAAIPANDGKTSSSVGVMDRVMAFKDESAPDQAARDEAIGKFLTFFYDPENYVGWVSMEGFLPAVNSAVEALVAADPSFEAWLDVLSSCQFYPTAKAEWDAVKQGVITAEQNALAGASVQDELDALQAEIAG